MREFLRSLRIISLVILFEILIISYALAANYPLEIIQPRAGLTTGILAENRFYKAYPHLEYNVKVAVIGGAYPFTYSLTTAPPGMTINASTGVISWPDPSTITADNCNTAPGCDVTARVSDSEGSFTTVSWSVKVTVTNFIFVDGTNGTHKACGTAGYGQIGDPMKSIVDWYCGTTASAKADNHYANNFVIYRAGTYINDAWPNSADGNRLQFNYTNKPMIHMAYPNDTVYMDMSVGGWHTDCCSKNFYVDRLNFINNSGPGPLILFLGGNGGNADNVTVRRSTFNTINGGTGSNNQSAIFSEVPNPFYGYHYWSITENTFTNFHHAYGVLFYQYDHILVADNSFNVFDDPANQGASHVIGMKGAPRYWFVRNNSLTNISGDSLDSLYANGTNNDTRDGEFSFNYVKNSSGSGLIINADCNTTTGLGGGAIYVYRNTFVGGLVSFNCPVTGGNGPFYAYNNVIQNTDTLQGDHIRCGTAVTCATNVIKTNTHGCPALCNLSGNSGLVDGSGNLINSGYSGIYGFTIGSALIPSPPTALTITP